MKPNCNNEFWHRPDGTNAEIYKSLVAEGRHRLAWEWLIRVGDFQLDCQAAYMGYVAADAVAEKWGLYRLKPFYEPYAAHRKPRFLVSKVRLFRAKPGQLVRHVALRPGEVAFVLDVERMLQSTDSRDAQIATMANLLDSAIERRRKRQNITPDAKSRVNVARLDQCLQLADLLQRAVPPDEIKRQVQYLCEVSTGGDVHGRFRDMKKRITELVTDRGYLVLASRAHTKSN